MIPTSAIATRSRKPRRRSSRASYRSRPRLCRRRRRALRRPLLRSPWPPPCRRSAYSCACGAFSSARRPRPPRASQLRQRRRRRASVPHIVTRARIVTASGTGRAAAIEIANGTAIHGARRHAREGRAKEPANPAVTAGRAARIATIAITVEENIAAKRAVPTDRVRRPVPMGRARGRVPMGRAAMPAAARVVWSEPMGRPQRGPQRCRGAACGMNLSSAPIVSGERGGRGRRRRGRGRREGGENTGNGQLTNAEANGRGPDSAAPRIDAPRADGGSYQPPAPEAASAGFSAPPSSPQPSSPASSPPPRRLPMAAAAPETPRPVTQEKYVVWSGSADTPRSGPDDR